MLTLVGLESHGYKRPSQLSGGQKQRVGIARAIANSPSLLLCDEATSALDPHTTTSILDLLVDINRSLGLTIILITHEMEVVRRFAHRVLVLDHGALIENGSMATLMRDSRGDPRLERLLADTRPSLPDTLRSQLSTVPLPDGLTLVRVVLGPQAAKTPFLSVLTRRFDQAITLIQGGTLACGSELLTDMILGFSEPLSEPLISFLEQETHVTEVLGYVRLITRLIAESTLQTIEMVAASSFVAVLFGLPLAVLMIATRRTDLYDMPWLGRPIGWVIDAIRAIPFIILLVLLIPVTRFIAGTSLGTFAAIVPLSIAAIPYYARIAEISLQEIEPGLIEAVRVMGGTRWMVIRYVLIPEALPGLLSGLTVTAITLVGASAMAGAIGAGGLGDLAIRYGYQRFNVTIMFAVVAVLILLVGAIQGAGAVAVRAVRR